MATSIARGVAVDDDHIYVADSDNHRVQIFDRETYAYQSTLGSFGTGDYEFNKPPDVAVDLMATSLLRIGTTSVSRNTTVAWPMCVPLVLPVCPI